MHDDPVYHPECCTRCYLEIAGVFLLALHSDGTIDRINRTGCEILGYSREEIIGQNWFDRFLPKDIRADVEEIFSGLLDGDEKQWEYVTSRVVTKSGEEKWIRWHNTILQDVSGEAAGTLSAGQDVTALVKAERALRSMEGHWRALLNSARDFGLYRIAIDHERPHQSDVLFASPSVEQILSPRDPSSFEAWFEEVHVEDKERVAAEGGRVFDQVMRVLHKRTGEWRWVHVVSTPTLDSTGRATHFNGMILDVTEQKKAEHEVVRHRDRMEELVAERTAELREANEKLQEEIAERRRAQEKIRRMNRELEERVKERTAELQEAMEGLKQLDRMKDAFVSSVSHELRTPLTSIRSFSELLLRCEESKETQKEFLDIINTESERLARLIDDVLDVSRIASGTAPWNDVEICLRDVVQEVVRNRQPQIEGKGIRLRVRFSKDIPDVRADPDRIRQVVENLLQNAIRFSHPGGEIVIRAERIPGKRSGDPPALVRCGITGEGIGIDPAESESIFDRFRQISADFLVDKPQGTGLGLSICREIIYHYGGNIWVESSPGEGSTFRFTLPALEDETAGAGTEEADSPVAEAATTGHTQSGAPLPEPLPYLSDPHESERA